MAQKPVNFVSWIDAARYANWVENGRGEEASTETGAFDLTGGGPAIEASSRETVPERVRADGGPDPSRTPRALASNASLSTVTQLANPRFGDKCR